MFISDVIEQAKALYPAEYTVKEYLTWCDELSADIRRNYDIRYGSIKACGTQVFLPPNVSVNDISKIIMDGRELCKTDLRDFGIDYIYTGGNRVLQKRMDAPSEFEIIYAVPHAPVRYIDANAPGEFNESFFSCPLSFKEGDSVKIGLGEREYAVFITKADKVFYYSGDTLPVFSGEAHFFREIQDKTLLPAPYDTAYVDFVNAKVALYQGDRNGYKNFTEQYNTKMSDYRQYLTRVMPRIKSKFINWFT